MENKIVKVTNVNWRFKNLYLEDKTSAGFSDLQKNWIYDLRFLFEKDQVDLLLEIKGNKFLVSEGVEIAPSRDANNYIPQDDNYAFTPTPEQFAENILSQAITIFQQRGTQYGTVEDNNLKHVKYANTLREILGPLGANEMAIQMCGNKLARLQTICEQGIKPNTKITQASFDDTVLDFINYFLFACGAKSKIMFNKSDNCYPNIKSQTQADRERDALDSK